MGLEWFWPAVGPAALTGGVLALLAEQLLVPAPLLPWRRPPVALAVHAGLWLALFTALLALTGRPWLAAGLGIGLVLAVVVVSNAKFRSLKEPFLFHDFEYFLDALRHPRLYLPFLRVGPLLVVVCGLALVGLEQAFVREPWELGAHPLAEGVVGVLGLALLSALLIATGQARHLPVSCDVAADLARLGLLVALWRYAQEMRRPLAVASPFDSPPVPRGPGPLPHLVVVQSESFADPRARAPGIRQDVLAQWDALCAEAVAWGALRVPAWGANTIRTEFAFLSGLAPGTLGVHQFQPYQRLARRALPQLVRWLKAAGYRTVAVHPYAGSFYQRERVFAALGFDEFIAGEAFRDAPRDGPYVSDRALTDKVRAILGNAGEQPLFVFAITMENHGPLHLERASASDLAAAFSGPVTDAAAELAVYLRHLRNADQMIAALREALLRADRPGCLCWYGDHVPMLPALYPQPGGEDGDTAYCVWHSAQAGAEAAPRPLAVDELALLLCASAGLMPRASADA